MHIILEHSQTKKRHGQQFGGNNSGGGGGGGRSNRRGKNNRGAFSRFDQPNGGTLTTGARSKWNNNNNNNNNNNDMLEDSRGRKRPVTERLGPMPPKRPSKVDTLFTERLEPPPPSAPLLVNHRNGNMFAHERLSWQSDGNPGQGPPRPVAAPVAADGNNLGRFQAMDPGGQLQQQQLPVPLMSMPPPSALATRMTMLEPPPTAMTLQVSEILTILDLKFM